MISNYDLQRIIKDRQVNDLLQLVNDLETAMLRDSSEYLDLKECQEHLIYQLTDIVMDKCYGISFDDALETVVDRMLLEF